MRKSIMIYIFMIFALEISAGDMSGIRRLSIDPSAYSDEPKEISEVSEKGKKLRYKPFGSTMYDIIIYTESGAAVWLNLYTKKVFPTGTFPINDDHIENTILASVGNYQPSFYQTTKNYWYLRSGEVSIGKKGSNWVFEIEAYTYNGSHIVVEYEGGAEYIGPYISEPQFSYDAEPEEKASLRYIFSKCNYDSHNGILGIDMQNDTTQMYIEMVTAEEEPPSGTYYITTDSVPGTLIASPGGTETADYGTFLAMFDKDENWLCSYYIVSGTLLVSREKGILTMSFAGISKNGSDVTISYSSPITDGIEHQRESGRGDGKRYNLLGQEVDSLYKGIIIENGEKRVNR